MTKRKKKSVKTDFFSLVKHFFLLIRKTASKKQTKNNKKQICNTSLFDPKITNQSFTKVKRIRYKHRYK